jgi:hypothetical protein
MIRWEPHINSPTDFVLSKRRSKVRRDENYGWSSPLHSQQLTDPISYFQLKILHNVDMKDGDGIIFGVCNASMSTTYKYLNPDESNCIYNNKNCLNMSAIQMIKPCTAVVGDVIGVVVDMIADDIRFYINTKLVAIGKTKPSKLQPLYAVLWMYYQHSEIEMGDYFPFYALESR